jgi:D-alanine-D-alanine ligase
VTRRLEIGLLYETRAGILEQHKGKAEALLYHWREPEEINAVAAALGDLGHGVSAIESLDQLLTRSSRQHWDLVWNLSVGALSRNRTALAPALLEQLSLPYTGADATAKVLCLNKQLLKPYLAQQGILTPPWEEIGDAAELTALPPWPRFILKPVCEGYSLGLTQFGPGAVLTDVQSCVEQLMRDFSVPVLCEQFIEGRELTVALIAGIEQYGAVETLTKDGQPMGLNVLDLQAKRYGGYKKVPIIGSDADCRQAHSVATGLMSKLEPLEYASFDFRITAAGAVYLIDINADATLHPERSFALGFQYKAVGYPQIIEMILNRSMRRWGIV